MIHSLLIYPYGRVAISGGMRAVYEVLYADWRKNRRSFRQAKAVYNPADSCYSVFYVEYEDGEYYHRSD